MKNFGDLSFDTLFKFTHSPVLLDGGFGTTLEDDLGVKISHSHLWSAQPLIDNEDSIIEAHLLFLRSGCKIISTATYQCSLETFKQAGLGLEQSKALMLQAVRLADRARTLFHSEAPDQKHETLPDHEGGRTLIALSLGPFGATLQPTQEFGGFYPPPYGPQKFNERGSNFNSFGESVYARRLAIDALADFHFQRLVIFLSDDNVWDSIDVLAFETIPLRREVIAIRKAIWRLHSTVQKLGKSPKPWWISCVFPDGESPNEGAAGGPRVQIDDLLEATFGDVEACPFPSPSGFGINCTLVKYIAPLSIRLRKYMQRAQMDNSHLWLILYPNGNDTYDEVTRSWRGPQTCDEMGWAEEVGAAVQEIMEAEGSSPKYFGGIIVGGCCKTSAKDIATLRYILDSQQSKI
ncbi:hypothetical protein M413DRAFT_172879 [Hebeloma cylindrosporum]|uniref:Hcy-binding domain-containing protein n=1 Tax=Hebeloma cylindrosporum TaxID=76867 RepID=A0A0C3C9D0_HEBCY|nr:hypothetical protein M413DRAFT_172879 [Hebeloma cylindrosporum h7]